MCSAFYVHCSILTFSESFSNAALNLEHFPQI
jgi:hypothetical protein